MMQPLTVTGMATANPLGLGLASTWDALQQGRHGLRPNDFGDVAIPTWIGRVEGLEREPLPGALAEFECRNNRLALLGLRQDGFEQSVSRARRRYGPHRIGVIIGTTTSGIMETELAYRRRAVTGELSLDTVRYRCTQNLFAVTEFVRSYLRLEGPAHSVSTACSSSAKAFACGSRLIAAGFCDAVVIGGVDSLCFMTLYGFHSLGLLATGPCRPCDAARTGLSISEAAGFVLLERDDQTDGAVSFVGSGESSDAYHMSSPHPDGRGAALAMSRALQSAGLDAEEIDYINLHGTGTLVNDRAEDLAVSRLFGDRTPCSSTKGATGHALGAAGITEAILTTLSLTKEYVPGTVQTTHVDPEFRSDILMRGRTRRLRNVMSNSFGFGGNNCSLIFAPHR